MLTLGVTGSAEGTTHRVTRDNSPRDTHRLRDMPEGSHIHRHRWDAGGFDLSCDVPDRHETDRSHGYQEHDVNLVRRELRCPLFR
jgi:hypothetical protein